MPSPDQEKEALQGLIEFLERYERRIPLSNDYYASITLGELWPQQGVNQKAMFAGIVIKLLKNNKP